MKHVLIATAAACTFAGAAQADGFGLSGFSVQGDYYYTKSGGSTFNNESLTLSGTLGMPGGSFFLQPEATFFTSGFTTNGYAAGAHLGYDIGNANLGLYATYNRWSPGPGFLAFGPEISGSLDGPDSLGSLEYEAYGGVFWNSSGGVFTTYVGGDLWHDMGNGFKVGAGLDYVSSSALSYGQFTLAARYDVTPNIYLQGSYTYTRPSAGSPGHTFGVEIGATVDQPLTFSPRNVISLTHGF